MRARVLAVGLVALLTAAAPKPAAAQQTRADTAEVLVAAARRLAAEGERDIAANLLRYIIRWYGDTPIAQEAARELSRTDRARAAGGGRIGFVVTNTLFGTWLGVAIPAAFEADDPTPYGVGLIAGPGLGLLGSLMYTKSYPITSGQTAAYRWSLIWLSWQAYLLQELTGIGIRETCFPDGAGGVYCYDETSTGARFGALVAGGAAGIGAGLALTRLNLPAGDVALVQDASAWGTALGGALSILTAPRGDPSDNAVFGWMAAAGNGMLLGAIPLARAWRPSVGRVRLITISGIAGSLVGLGIDLIGDVDDEKAVVAIPTVGAAIGLVAGTLLTARRTFDRTEASVPVDGGALVQLGRDAGIGVPLPEPRILPTLTPDGRVGRRPAMGFRIAELRF
jgi:hypothetical protein